MQTESLYIIKILRFYNKRNGGGKKMMMNRQGIFSIIVFFLFTVATLFVVRIDIADAYTLPDTGQSWCYNDEAETDYGLCTDDTTDIGQDAMFEINPPSLTDNDNGAITDNNTGLMWTKCAAGKNFYSCSGSATNYNWFEANGLHDDTYNSSDINVCGALRTANYSDWRLPTKKEIMSIFNYDTSNPALDETFFPNMTDDPSYYLWTSTTSAHWDKVGWAADYLHGEMVHSRKPDSEYYESNGYVLCVRGGQTITQTFTDNGDYTVTDNRTGLTWQKCSSGQTADSACSGSATTSTWVNALSYCNDLTLGSVYFNDWRLPNIKELESLSDDTLWAPSINTSYFPNNPSAYPSNYWSSTTYFAMPGAAHVVDFRFGIVDDISKDGSYYPGYVRCVRGGTNTCSVSAISINGIAPYYPTISAAYAQVSNGQAIDMQALIFTESNLTFNKGFTVALKGGYNCGFTSNTGYSTIKSSVTITSDTVKIDRIIIK
jgi:hypothetical protein